MIDTEWTCLAGIVAEVESKFSVISLGLGTRCCGHEEDNFSGRRLNDCHAETLCRRSFRSYILEEILTLCGKKPNRLINSRDKVIQQPHFPILKKGSTPGLFSYQSDIKFHFYVSHLPCGLCTVIDFNETVTESNLNVSYTDTNRSGSKSFSEHFNLDDSQKERICRLKPVRSDVPIERRNMSLSCSDKLNRWMKLGFEGSILNSLIEEQSSNFICAIHIGGPIFDEAVIRNVLDLDSKIEVKHSTKWIFSGGRSEYGKRLKNENIAVSSGIAVSWRRDNYVEMDYIRNKHNFKSEGGWGYVDCYVGASGMKFGSKPSNVKGVDHGLPSKRGFALKIVHELIPLLISISDDEITYDEEAQSVSTPKRKKITDNNDGIDESLPKSIVINSFEQWLAGDCRTYRSLKSIGGKVNGYNERKKSINDKMGWISKEDVDEWNLLLNSHRCDPDQFNL